MTPKTASALDRPLVSASGPNERHLMLTLQLPEGEVRRLPLNLALVVDASGSMSGEKLARARDAASFVVRHLTAADRVAIVAYDDEVTVVAPSTLLAPTAKTDLLHAIAGIETGGSTNLSGGWLAGCQQVALHQSGDEQMDRALLLTDGLANAGITAIDELVEHARQLRLRGIVTSTMGIGVDFNGELLEAMARHGGGRFQYVETARHIPDCVRGELGEMARVAARNVVVEVDLPRGVRCLSCLNDYVTEETPRGVRIRLGDLLAADTRTCVLRLSVRASAGQETLPLAARALYVDTDTARGEEVPFDVAALRCGEQDAVDTQPTDDAVAREVALLLAARAKEEAARLSRRGERREAAQFLRAASVGLCAMAAPGDAAVSGEADALSALAGEMEHGEMSEARLKDVHYDAYLRRERRTRYDTER